MKRCLPILIAIVHLASCKQSPPSALPIDGEAGSSWKAEPREVPPEIPPPPIEKTPFTMANNAFAANIWNELRKDPGNLVISPASVTAAFVMALVGARGETAEEMKKALHVTGSVDEMANSAGEFVKRWKESHGPTILRSTNGAFAQKNYLFEKPFIDAATNTFDAPLQIVDFAKDPEGARQTVNRWIEVTTEHRIRAAIPMNGFSQWTRLVLLNTLYFKADWEGSFDDHATSRDVFHVSSTEKKTVSTMHTQASFRYAEQPGVQVLELPYKGDNEAMVFLLPTSMDGLGAFEQNLTPEKLDQLLDATKNKVQVSVSLPKFELDSPVPLSLRKSLQSQGMRLAFDRSSADFSGIGKPKDPAENLYLDDIMQKVYLRVDERGTEAAVSTTTAFRAYGGLPKIYEFRADHPFLFILRDKITGLILFMGRINDPSSP